MQSHTVRNCMSFKQKEVGANDKCRDLKFAVEFMAFILDKFVKR